MRVTSITANRHIFAGRLNGKPLRLLVSFDDSRTLRLAVAGDGEQMIFDDQPLDQPFEMAEAGAVDIADVTEALVDYLRNALVENVRALDWDGRHVGVQLALTRGRAFYIWVDGDELHWGGEPALIAHEWPEAMAPTLGERVQV